MRIDENGDLDAPRAQKKREEGKLRPNEAAVFRDKDGRIIRSEFDKLSDKERWEKLNSI